jgi:hypothetical protein
MRDDPDATWYHGSPLRLEVLRGRSTITQWRDLARVFSHKPPIVCITDEGTLQHNGTQPGYLYEIAEPVTDGDVIPHPRTTMRPGDEWLTTRELRLRLLGETRVRAEEFLTESDVAVLLQRRDGTVG